MKKCQFIFVSICCLLGVFSCEDSVNRVRVQTVCFNDVTVKRELIPDYDYNYDGRLNVLGPSQISIPITNVKECIIDGKLVPVDSQQYSFINSPDCYYCHFNIHHERIAEIFDITDCISDDNSFYSFGVTPHFPPRDNPKVKTKATKLWNKDYIRLNTNDKHVNIPMLAYKDKSLNGVLFLYTQRSMYAYLLIQYPTLYCNPKSPALDYICESEKGILYEVKKSIRIPETYMYRWRDDKYLKVWSKKGLSLPFSGQFRLQLDSIITESNRLIMESKAQTIIGGFYPSGK